MFARAPSPYPALSPERIAAARKVHGSAVDHYLGFTRRSDTLADAVVLWMETMAPGEGMGILHQAIKMGIDKIPNPPPSLIALFAELDYVPFWVDMKRMRLGSAKILQSGLLTGIAFATNALPYAFLSTANLPLTFTGQLLEQSPKRFAQTTRFVIETFMPDGLARDADGFELVVHVRLMHAKVRRRILKSGNWDQEKFGLPVNQAHMALDTIFFSFFVLNGLQRLGVPFKRGEIEGVLLVWRYVGYLFGLHPDLLCSTEEEARRLVDVAFSLEFDPDENAKKLCAMMLEAGPSYLGIRDPRGARLFKRSLYPVSRHLLGEELADGLGIPAGRNPCFYGILKTVVKITYWMPWLVPRSIRNYMGVQFWLENSHFDMGHFNESDFRK